MHLTRVSGQCDSRSGGATSQRCADAGTPTGDPESLANVTSGRKYTGKYWMIEGDEALPGLATLKRNERWHRLFSHTRSTISG